MKSQNFEFLRLRHPELASLGGFAEQYTLTDPSSALIKLRTLVEQVVETIYDQQRLSKPYGANLNDMLQDAMFKGLVPRVVLDKLHAVRTRGNKAAHGHNMSPEVARAILRQAYDVAGWFHLTFNSGKRPDIKPFTLSDRSSSPSKGKLQREKKELLQKLTVQEAQLQQALKKLEDARSERVALERAKQEEIDALQQAAQEKADELAFDEEQTRKFLIDSLLVSAGWDVGENGADTSSVGQEVKLDGLPTTSGKGRADYVLWGDDGKPLAVVEAKRTSKDPRLGKTQAQQYADALEVHHGQRPIIFYTNGVEIWLWDDGPTTVRPADYPPRKVYGFYSKDSLEYLIFQRANAKRLELQQPNPNIAGRMYQVEAIRRVTEHFAALHRKALIVQATGTGKTRVAISLCEFLTRARWAKRILFLCDRRELRKQADKTFKEFLPTEPRTFVTSKTSSDLNKRIYLATYPAMMRCFESFDVGFFDLIIADESHRSIYNKYRDLFRYFDSLQIGLTATPERFVERNTYKLFGCKDKDPTYNYSFEEAVNHVPPYLTRFEVVKVTTRFQRDGIKYSQMSDEERIELESQVEDAETFEHEAAELDKRIFNKDTSRSIIRNLMEDGIRDASGSLPGKSIVFARNHRHAVHLAEIFSELYPMYGGEFCQVIDNYDPRAEQLIENFKDPEHKLRIAVSVDMLDTGIDVPEIVNLVFAKPVRSYVKFWQMIGRGTRLRPDLFGPGQDKEKFLIFDHWGNFDYFAEKHKEVQPPISKSLMHRVFEARVALMEAMIEQMTSDDLDMVVEQMAADIQALKATKAIEVRDHWRDLQVLGKPEVLQACDPSTISRLKGTVAPLMRWVDIRGHEDAYRLDELVAQMQKALLEGSSALEDLKGKLLGDLDALPKTLNQVRAKGNIIKEVRNDAFWDGVTVQKLEDVRLQLRSIMRHKLKTGRPPALSPRVIDVTDGDEQREEHIPTLDGLELIAYRQRVESLLKERFEENPVLLRIKEGYAVTEDELNRLSLAILKIDPQIDLKHLPIHINLKGDLHRALRSIVGLDAQAVDAAFTGFTHAHNLTATQVRFLSMLKAHICANGGLDVGRLYEAPFTALSADGIDGVFEDDAIDELLELIARFNLPDIQGAIG